MPAKLKAEFALRVTGDSMSWAGIHEGDLAILKRTDAASSGMIVAAGIEEDTWAATLKYDIKDTGHTVLRAANPEYSDVTYTTDHRVIGYAVAVLKDPPSYNTYKNLLMRKDITSRKWQLAVEIATQSGLDGEQVANLIGMFLSSVRSLKNQKNKSRLNITRAAFIHTARRPPSHNEKEALLFSILGHSTLISKARRAFS